MRINAHSHIFNLRSVFTKETQHILLNRLRLDGMPDPIMEVLQDRLGKYLENDIDSDDIMGRLGEKIEASKEFLDVIEKLKANTCIDLHVDGVPAKLGEAGAEFIRKKILELCDLENGEIRQNWLDYFEFLRIALSPSIEKVADEVRRQMRPEDGLVALMMDITDGTDDGTLVERHVRETSDVVLAYPGAVFPFFMVNSARPNHFRLMKNAIETQGFWGVKLYPSLGYPVVSDAMFEVYDYCQKNRIPMLTHCTDGGFYKNKQTAPLASPEPWREVLKEFKKLKICFGHFGGAQSLIHEQIPPESWTRQIIDLMHDFEGVFTDIGFHTDPILGNVKEKVDKHQARRNYERNIKTLLQSPTTGDRILFGTDFWLVRMVTEDDDYWTFFQNLLGPDQLKQVAETNPSTYLGLPGTASPSDWLVERQLAFFKSKKMRVQREPAEWLENAAAALMGPDMRFVPIGSGPSWAEHNYIHRILFEYLWKENVFRKADKDLELSFEAYGRFKLVNLTYWDESPEPAAFETAVRLVASNINEAVIVRYKKWTDYNTAQGITETKARQRLVDALKKTDWYVYQLAELCDKLYVYKLDLPKEEHA